MLCCSQHLLGVFLTPDQETVLPDDFIRHQIEAEWRQKIGFELGMLQKSLSPAQKGHLLSVLPSVISGLTVIAAVVGMLWSFMLNQTTFQAVNTQKLDNLSATLTEIRKNADQVPLIALQLQNMDVRQKNTEEQEKKNEQKLSDVSETLIRMGVRTAK